MTFTAFGLVAPIQPSYEVHYVAPFSDTKLNRAWLQGANLKNCDMNGATLGELAYKTFEYEVESCAYSPNGKLFAVTCGFDVLLLPVSASGTLGDVVQTFTGHTGTLFLSALLCSPLLALLSSMHHSSTDLSSLPEATHLLS